MSAARTGCFEDEVMNEVVATALVTSWQDCRRVGICEWAERYRLLTSAESPYPGLWRWERTPYLIEPAEDLAHGRNVVLVFAAQLGKTELSICYLGWLIDQAPGPVLILRPTLDDCETLMRQRLKYLFGLPRLMPKVARPEMRDEAATTYLREFRGGVVMLAGANSAVRLASRPIRYLICDEVDKYPESVGGEGDPMELARARLTAFGRKARQLIIGTPTIKGHSRVEREWQVSSQAEYWVPCPYCGYYQVLRWTGPDGQPRIVWSGDVWSDSELQVGYVCEGCKQYILESEKPQMLRRGEWRHAYPERALRGYRLSALYAPPGWLSWRDLVREWVRAVERQRAGDLGPLQVFINVRLAEWWEEWGEPIDIGNLEVRLEEWRILPSRVQVITAGVDIQEDRIECEVVAWAEGYESWSLAYHIIYLDPLDQAAWEELDRRLETCYETEDGRRMKTSVVCVDAGFRTQEVLAYCRRNAHRGRLAVKGVGGQGRPIWIVRARKTKAKGLVAYFYTVGVDTAKDAIHGYLRIRQPGPGYCHFHKSRLTEVPDYFSQLTAERRIKTVDKYGRIHYRWKALEHRRQECLDCRVYALAAVHAWQSMGHSLARSQTPASQSAIGRDLEESPKRVRVQQSWWADEKERWQHRL